MPATPYYANAHLYGCIYVCLPGYQINTWQITPRFNEPNSNFQTFLRHISLMKPESRQSEFMLGNYPIESSLTKACTSRSRTKSCKENAEGTEEKFRCRRAAPDDKVTINV
jgi:hypothetical protein